MTETLLWYVRLRWAGVVALTVLTGAVAAGVAPAWPLAGLTVLLASGASSNAAWARRVHRDVPDWVVAGVIGVDAVLLTLLLSMTGGPASPFALLYIVPVVVASFLLPARWAWGTVALTGLGYGSLFLAYPEAGGTLGVPGLGGGTGAGRCRAERLAHVRGLAMAYGFAGPVLALLVTRVRAVQQEAEARIADARALQARSERLTSLATLAAGAAHELASPLSTILLVSGELRRRTDDARDTEDLDLVRDEVERCRTILGQLAADAGAGMGEAAEPVDVRSLVEAAVEARHRPVVLEGDPGTVALPARLVTQVLRRLLGNARDASGDAPITVRLSRDDGLRIQVIDTGAGMPSDVLARATEPFFTTKPEGRGTGLGLFFVDSVVQHLGGELTIASAEEEGTTVTIAL